MPFLPSFVTSLRACSEHLLVNPEPPLQLRAERVLSSLRAELALRLVAVIVFAARVAHPILDGRNLARRSLGVARCVRWALGGRRRPFAARGFADAAGELVLAVVVVELLGLRAVITLASRLLALLVAPSVALGLVSALPPRLRELRDLVSSWRREWREWQREREAEQLLFT